MEINKLTLMKELCERIKKHNENKKETEDITLYFMTYDEATCFCKEVRLFVVKPDYNEKEQEITLPRSELFLALEMYYKSKIYEFEL